MPKKSPLEGVLVVVAAVAVTALLLQCDVVCKCLNHGSQWSSKIN